MRLIIPVIIVLLGAVVGYVVNSLFNGREDVTDVPPYLSLIAGVLGAFVGMFVRDALSITMIGNFTDTFIASVSGAAVFAAIAHLVLRSRR